MRKTTGWLLVVVSILIAVTRISALAKLTDKADAASKMIPELLIIAALGIFGLYLAGVIKSTK